MKNSPNLNQDHFGRKKLYFYMTNNLLKGEQEKSNLDTNTTDSEAETFF